MATKNRKCLSCGETYSYCPDCSRADKLAPSWKASFCSEQCKDLWSTLTKFGMEQLTKNEAKSIIETLELKPISSYVACVQRDYTKIMAEDKKSKKSHKKIEYITEIEPIVETDAVIGVEPVVEIEPIVNVEAMIEEADQPVEVEIVHEVVETIENE